MRAGTRVKLCSDCILPAEPPDGQVRAYDLLRGFGREGRPTPLGQAFAAYGRFGKTLHLLRMIVPVDDPCRRQMNRQLTVQESRHKPARDICHGKRGQIMQAYREGQKDQLGALGLVLNAAVLRTIRNLDAAVEQLRALPPEERDTTSWTSTSPSSPGSGTRTSTRWAAGRPLRGERHPRFGPCRRRPAPTARPGFPPTDE